MPDAQGLKVAPTRVEPEDRDPVDVEFVGQCVQDGLDDAADGSVEEDGGVEVVDGSETRELALEPAVEFGGPALGMDAFGDVLRDDQPRLGSVERQAVRGDVDVDGGAILERVDPDPFVAVSVVGALFEVRQELGPVSGRSDVGKPHGEERVLAVAVALHHGVVDSEESERGGVVDVHRQGVALEQVAEGVFAGLESLFGGASRADVLFDRDEVADGCCAVAHGRDGLLFVVDAAVLAAVREYAAPHVPGRDGFPQLAVETLVVRP